ncbi:MAG: type II secretion system F family protein [Clostridiaceae bacterium]
MELLVYTLIFLSAFLTFLFMGQFVFDKNHNVIERMNSIKTMFASDEDADEMKKSFSERVISPAYEKIINWLGSVTPASIKKKYEELIIQAGTGKTITVNSLIAIQIMLAALLASMCFLLLNIIGSGVNFMLIFFSGILGFYLPYFILNSYATKRQNDIQKVLPDLLDLLYISVEAGLGFDMALKKSAEKMPGALSDEINKALYDISKGRDRQEAMRGIVKRTGVDDINTFITAVIQSEQLGTNISSMLRTQSNVMRQKRRQRAEAAAAKIPVKMLFPMVFLLFPALFVVILGPAIISIMESL